MNLPSLSDLPSASLTSSIAELRSKQRLDDVQFLWLLAEFDRRRTYESLGFGSLWDYCTAELHLTNGAAGRRIAAARLLAKFPAAADFLADGRLGLTTFGMLKDLLTEENHLSVLASAAFKNEREVDQLVRTHLPLSFSRDTVVRSVSAPQLLDASPTPAAENTLDHVAVARATAATGANELVDAALAGTTPAPGVNAAPITTARVRAVDADCVSLTIRVPKEFMADLEQVSAALSHIVINRKPADVLWECIRRTLAERARRKGGLPARPTPASGVTSGCTPAPGVTPDSAALCTPAPGVTPDSNAPCTPAPGVTPGSDAQCTPAPGVTGSGPDAPCTPAPGVIAPSDSAATCAPSPGACGARRVDSGYVQMELARLVWERDESCCAYVAPDGRRCRSTHQLEIHHRRAHALGGPTSASNLSLYCHRHNLLAAELDFGSELIASFRG